MTTNVPILPVAGGTLVHAFLSLLAFVTRWVKGIARARRHRREAAILAGLDRRMLADIGISRADLHDAFSEPFWEEPTALLRERAGERRRYRPSLHLREAPAAPASGQIHPQPAHRRALPML